MLWLNILATILFMGTTTFVIVTEILTSTAMLLVFRKCGVPGWHAFVPCLKSYELGLCADREMEGRILFFTDLCAILTGVLQFVPIPHRAMLIIDFLALFISLIGFMHKTRIFLGLFRVFGMKKGWILFNFISPCISLFRAGLSRKEPAWKVSDTRAAKQNYFDNADVAVMDQGLTLNLKSRTVREFFTKKYLLRNIHINIEPGRMVLLLGGSGAGKTTLLNAINGYEKADAKVNLNGSDVYADYKKMMYEVGFVPQQDLMRYQDTVLSTLTDAAALRLPANFSRSERRARVDEVMKMFGLLPVQNNQVGKLSGGQRKRLSIAMEFISNPSLFILDEPDSGLDGVMARELMTKLKSIAAQGKIIIVITHTPDRVIDLFDDVIVLAKDAERTGRLAWFGTVEGAKAFFGKDSMEDIVMSVNRVEEGGEGCADEFIRRFAEVQNV